jgi:hypothetical protein
MMSGAAVPVSSVRLAAAATYGHSPYMCMHALVPGDGEGEGLLRGRGRTAEQNKREAERDTGQQTARDER